MNSIAISARRRVVSAPDRVRESRFSSRVRRAAFRTEVFPGELVLADLAASRNDMIAAGRVLARYAVVRSLETERGHPPHEQALAEWLPLLRDTTEGSALVEALEAPSGSVRTYRAFLDAARQAVISHHFGGAFVLRRLAFRVARSARRRAAAARAARLAARAAARAGAYAAALHWDRVAARCRALRPAG
jgi:hypothetical protein